MASYPKWTHFIVVARVSMFMRDDRESCRISVGCLKQNGGLQHLEIEIMYVDFERHRYGLACDCGVCRMLIMTYHRFCKKYFLQNGFHY